MRLGIETGSCVILPSIQETDRKVVKHIYNKEFDELGIEKFVKKPLLVLVTVRVKWLWFCVRFNQFKTMKK